MIIERSAFSVHVTFTCEVERRLKHHYTPSKQSNLIPELQTPSLPISDLLIIKFKHNQKLANFSPVDCLPFKQSNLIREFLINFELNDQKVH